MNKRVIAAVAAGVLAVAGVAVLLVWTSVAQQRAYDGATLVSVVRMSADVESGTPVSALADKTQTVKLPESAVPDGAVHSLDDVAGLATNSSVKKGEVLLASRLGTPGARGKGAVDVPKGMQEVTFALDGQRTVGGSIKPGDKVGIWGNFDDPRITAPLASQVLVTRVSSAADASTQNGVSIGLVVTIAAASPQIEKVIFAMDHGKIWLTLQNADTDTSSAKTFSGGDLK